MPNARVRRHDLGTPGFTSARGAAAYPAMTMDMFWSWFAMPIGLSICFWPFLVAWYLAERKDSSARKD
jgi:hypothetical protein